MNGSKLTSKKFLFPLFEYNRIYRIAHGILQDIGKVEKACIFFASLGSYLLNKHYKIPSRPVAGAFALCVNDEPDVACFGRQGDQGLSSDPEAFHMWIQTETHIIDFMAPVFPEAFAKYNPPASITRKMLQKRLGDEAANASELKAAGDFFTLPDPELTEKLLDQFLETPGNTDLIAIGEKWFGKRGAKQKPLISMTNDLGQIYHLNLPKHAVLGSW
ncbi:hypothetical protein FIV06_04350 [Labrenzia sp. THAF191b]|uniref:DUF2026 family protein n=1 Tax=unclassified Labrenzia TaxID=2648686 RepID=UPI0012692584|nr:MULTISPECIES: DUF2026 family protein [unclassified Labrenzia]QFS96638.1 hypothetical protein FIV06_04350 [Labrenzia sp. THAF191b]QFT02953.1 hypothetical protein FIV05_04350 [Labrenzia sp. THAF191a]QFT14495.1 hypothetical protein FIV03_04355 [Labrenzia sp. THAF187b]